MDSIEDQAPALLEAAGRITELADLSDVLYEVVRTACHVLGFERARIYLALTKEGVLREEAAEGVGCEADIQSGDPGTGSTLPLETSNLLGQVALNTPQACTLCVGALSDPGEADHGVPTCFAPIMLHGSLLGVLVADCPETRREINGHSQRCLDALAQFSAVAIKRAQFDVFRNTFVASVSHELRAPLTSIAAFCEMLADGDAGPLNQEQQQFLDRVIMGSQQLQKIVEDLLELSHLQLRTRPIAKDSLVVKSFLQDMALNFLPQAEGREVALTVVAPDHLPALVTDQRRLQQALTNLIDNAIKYSPRGSEVCLVAEMRCSQLRLSVSDNGPGIAPEDQPHIFDDFYRCRRGVTDRSNEGLGLGLAIVARIGSMLGAEIEVESCLGTGSIFTLVFADPQGSPEEG